MSLPNFFTVRSSKFNLLNAFLTSCVFTFILSIRISIKVPPLKSTPKFKPLNSKKTIEITEIKIDI